MGREHKIKGQAVVAFVTLKDGVGTTLRLGLLALCVSTGTAAAQTDTPVLYVCDGWTNTQAAIVGVTLCDAEPTAELSRRAEEDNLQVREGALVVELESTGVSDEAGLQPGDMIYRVGGTDVGDAEGAAGSLAEVRTASDTVVNFLRGGRPYRVKLRYD